jgi:hypothetical protein
VTNRSTSVAGLVADLTAHGGALTRPRTHRESRWTWDANRNRKPLAPWVTRQPSLLEQLAAAVVPSEAYAAVGAGGRVAPRSTPPARLDAIDRWQAIEAAALRWSASLGLRARPDLAGRVSALVAAGAGLDAPTLAALLAEVRAWHYWAATVVGWLTPPWRPLAPCPACQARDRLRVRLDQGTACCLGCGRAWGPDTIDALAASVRAYREASRDASRERSRREPSTARH